MSDATNITGFGLYYLCTARSSNGVCSTDKICGDLSYTALGLSGGLKIQLNIRAQYKDISVYTQKELFKEYDACIMPNAGAIAPHFDEEMDRLSEKYFIF